MDHEQINQFDLIDQYVMGKLSAEESAEFEEHFVDCPQCIARLQTTENFLRDLRMVAAEQTSQSRKPGIAFRQFLQTLFPRYITWAIVCLLIAATLVAIFTRAYVQRLQSETSQAKSLSEEWERRYENERESVIAHQAAESQQAERLRALEAKLKEEGARRAKMESEFRQQMRPQGNLLAFNLVSVRGEPNTSEPVNPISLPRAPVAVAFHISLEDEQRFEKYRITIFDARRKPVWKSDPLTPNQQGSLSIVLDSRLFRPGRYSLLVRGVKKEGGSDVFGHYPFLIIKAR